MMAVSSDDALLILTVQEPLQQDELIHPTSAMAAVSIILWFFGFVALILGIKQTSGSQWQE